MNGNLTNIPSKSVYSIGAADGVWIGLAMGLFMLCMVLSATYPTLAFVGIFLMVAVPVAVWKFLKRAWVSGAVPATFSAVWLHGICIFLFGGIIMALITYISLKYVSPHWIETQTRLAAIQLSQDPATAEQARIITKIIDSGELPSAIYTSISSIWLVAFTGSLWSMIFAFFLTKTSRYRRMRELTISQKQ